MLGDPRFGLGPVFSSFTGRGDLGVDFFFVLSGFIIMFAHSRDIGRPETLGRYTLKRIIRIYPVYWLFTLLVIAGGAIIGGSSHRPEAPQDILSVFSLVRFTSTDTPIPPAWTLFHEVIFYAVFASLLVRRWLGMAVLGVWFAAIVARFHYAQHGEWSFTNDLLSAHNLSFLCGVAAYFLMARLDRKTALIAFVLGLAGLVAALSTEAVVGRSSANQFAFSLCFMVIMAGAVALERAGALPTSNWLGHVGDASYTLYLAHESVMSALLKIISKVGALRAVAPALIYVVVFSGAVVFALIFYRLVERPLTRSLQLALLRKPQEA